MHARRLSHWMGARGIFNLRFAEVLLVAGERAGAVRGSDRGLALWREAEKALERLLAVEVHHARGQQRLLQLRAHAMSMKTLYAQASEKKAFSALLILVSLMLLYAPAADNAFNMMIAILLSRIRTCEP